ncbi:D-galactose 1-dehydrogenase [Loktanella ponticola]|uniref:D-galactose 1-dehydrogenase n=1 Tax=Yoonia ponticola TaxID=1524255 RepID=A0A7W9BIF3_9RHOB|nr:Gfo/Idh/MocA family oxidoreductase [Yoonia ponticola]MBB5721137.1 D-galactose 1-dehydrogenase [Yoonia ponticola]
MKTKICLIGIGKIAVDQHVPAISGSDDWTLAATVSRVGTVDGVPSYTDFDQMLADHPDIPVISLCLPTVPRFEYAAKAMAAGRHVMLEKPPGATISEVHMLQAMAKDHGVSLFATWHSRAAVAVQPAKTWLADKSIKKAHITWKEDVRKWHPNQDWVFEPGGMGVFDPGINALSIITEILPFEMRLQSAILEFPTNRDTPIAAKMQWADNISGEFDWRQEGSESWDITLETDGGLAELKEGGARFFIDGVEQPVDGLDEYPALYKHMKTLVDSNTSDIDVRPLIQVADALTLGKRISTDAFAF